MSESSQSFQSSSQSSSSGSPANCEFGIRLLMEMSKYNFTNDPEHPQSPIRSQAWRMRVTVTEVNNIDPNIFVFNLGDLDAEAGIKRKWFQNVASPTDLVEYPIGQPNENETPQFFRLASVDMVHRSLDVLDATWAAIKSDVNELIEASARLCELEVQESAAIGTLPDEPVPEPEPEPEPSESSESSLAVECPDDPVDLLEIVESTDPEFPAGMLLTPAGVEADCVRVWTGTSTSGYLLTLRTSMISHQVSFILSTGDITLTDIAGLSYTYGAMLHYAYDAIHEHSIRITGA